MSLYSLDLECQRSPMNSAAVFVLVCSMCQAFAGLVGLEFQQAEECPGGHLSDFWAITGPHLRAQVGCAEELISSCSVLLFSILISATNWAIG